MVRTAATEAMCNLVPHKLMMEHLAEGDNIRLWLAFAVDYEDNYECARAAAGCLVMATQDESIAKAVTNLPTFKEEMTFVLECGRLEIMHRGVVLVLNLVELGEEMRGKAKVARLVVFSRAYLEIIFEMAPMASNFHRKKSRSCQSSLISPRKSLKLPTRNGM
jgi:hypothetical protein